MIRVQPFLDDCTATFARTTHGRRPCTATESVAIHKYKAPAHRRFFYGLCRWGWAIVPAVLALSVLTGCDDIDMHIAVQADLADAIATAAKEAGNVEVAAK